MACSDGAVSTAQVGRVSSDIRSADKSVDYRVVLPPLPTGAAVLNTVFLHCDVSERPYKISDFRTLFDATGVLTDLKGCGPYRMNHVWMATFHSPASKQKLLAMNEARIKDKRCLFMDPNTPEVTAKLHWVPFHVPDDLIRTALEPYGKVESVIRECWREEGFGNVESSTRSVRLKLKDGVTLERLPHQLRLLDVIALMVVHGRTPMCLRCGTTGHVRRQCRVPRCASCRRFGHSSEDCVKTYATVTKSVPDDEETELVMDEEEAEATARDINPPNPEQAGAPLQASTVPDATTATSLKPQVEETSETPCDVALAPLQSTGSVSEPVDASATVETTAGPRDDEDQAEHPGHEEGTPMDDTTNPAGKRPLDATGFESVDLEADDPRGRTYQWRVVGGRRARLNPKPRLPPDDRRRDRSS